MNLVNYIVRGRKSIERAEELRERGRELGGELVLRDIGLANDFLDRAEESSAIQERERLFRIASKAHASIVHRVMGTKFSPLMQEQIEASCRELAGRINASKRR